MNPPLQLSDVVPGLPVELVAVPFHAQLENHCGPASLLTVLEHSGVEVDYDDLVGWIYTPGLEGSLQLEMLAAARRFERLAYQLAPEPEALFAEVAAGRPVLVLLNLGVRSAPIWHYAVVVGFDLADNRVLSRSGDESRRAEKASAWLRRWDWAGRWAVVLLPPGEWPASPRRERLLRALADFEDSATPASARQAWRRATTEWPAEPLAWLGLGNAAHRLADWKAAEIAYRRALTLAPEDLPVRLNLALSMLESGRPCAALAELPARPPGEHSLVAAFLELEERLRRRCSALGAC
ncbi:MAG: PA2778 family cysteine peptidase [Acidobacteria bacterium]|nr:PA2778 family cysteine peptidase [Acidobacteriota bacterium]